jgi:hypothetical protein
MPLPRMRFTIGRLMAVVAVSAVALAVGIACWNFARFWLLYGF